jgi:hypothetical protein
MPWFEKIKLYFVVHFHFLISTNSIAFLGYLCMLKALLGIKTYLGSTFQVP